MADLYYPKEIYKNNSNNNTDIIDAINSRGSAFTQGTIQGLNDYASTIDKVGAKIYQNTGIDPRILFKPMDTIMQYQNHAHDTPESIQQGYEQELQRYNQNPDTNAHPLLSGAGRLTGNMIATAPIAGPAGEAGFLTTLNRGIASGMVQGGLFNQPGQGSDIWNKQGAAVGGITGGLFAPIQYYMQSAAKELPKLADDFIPKKLVNTQKEAKNIISQYVDQYGNLDTQAATNALEQSGTTKNIELLKNLNLLLANPKVNQLVETGAAGLTGGAIGGIAGAVYSGGDPGTTAKWAGYGAGGLASLKSLNTVAGSNTLRNLVNTSKQWINNSDMAKYFMDRLGDAGILIERQQQGNLLMRHQDDKSPPERYNNLTYHY